MRRLSWNPSRESDPGSPAPRAGGSAAFPPNRFPSSSLAAAAARPPTPCCSNWTALRSPRRSTASSRQPIPFCCDRGSAIVAFRAQGRHPSSRIADARRPEPQCATSAYQQRLSRSLQRMDALVPWRRHQSSAQLPRLAKSLGDSGTKGQPRQVRPRRHRRGTAPRVGAI